MWYHRNSENKVAVWRESAGLFSHRGFKCIYHVNSSLTFSLQLTVQIVQFPSATASETYTLCLPVIKNKLFLPVTVKMVNFIWLLCHVFLYTKCLWVNTVFLLPLQWCHHETSELAQKELAVGRLWCLCDYPPGYMDNAENYEERGALWGCSQKENCWRETRLIFI